MRQLQSFKEQVEQFDFLIQPRDEMKRKIEKWKRERENKEIEIVRKSDVYKKKKKKRKERKK